MSRFLAIDWDENELRYVLAEVAGRKAKVRAIGAVPLEDAEEGGESQIKWGAALADELKERKLGRPKLLIGVPRASVELLHLTVPPAKDEELPELVANQAINVSPAIDERWILDFLTTSDDPSLPREITAMAISPDTLEEIKRQAAAAGLKPERMVYRPLAAASLFRRLNAGEDPSCLLINRTGCEADLDVLKEGKVLLSRTVRLPPGAEEAESNERLQAEIIRTLAIAPLQQTDDEAAPQVYVLGSDQQHHELIEQLMMDRGLAAKALDPFVALKVPEQILRPDRGRFSSLLGMLLDEAAAAHAIDLLHPRKSRPPVSRWRTGAIAGGAAAAAILVIVLHVWMTVSEINDENRRLYGRYRELDATMKKVAEQKKQVDAIAAWNARDVNWLDEMRDLSIRFPGPRDAVVLRMNMRLSSGSGGLIDLQGLVRDPKVLANMERQVRDESRRVQSRRIQERTLEQDYTWMFETSMAVARRSKDRYISHLASPDEPAGDEPTVPDDIPEVAEVISP